MPNNLSYAALIKVAAIDYNRANPRSFALAGGTLGALGGAASLGLVGAGLGAASGVLAPRGQKAKTILRRAGLGALLGLAGGGLVGGALGAGGLYATAKSHQAYEAGRRANEPRFLGPLVDTIR